MLYSSLGLFPMSLYAREELPRTALQVQFGAVGANDVARVTVRLEPSNVGVNALEGSVMFDADKLNFIGSKLNESVIQLWVTEPSEEKKGVIYFAGIIPGGFSSGGVIAQLEFAATSHGNTVFRLNGVNIGLQRAPGDVIAAPAVSAKLFLDKNAGALPVVHVFEESPIEFLETGVSHNADFFSNQWFVPFVAKNKSADIQEYFVQETSFWQPRANEWMPVQSPYVLEDQNRGKYVFIKARDVSGAEATYTIEPSWFRQTKFWAAIISLLGATSIVCMFIFFHRRSI